MVIGYIVSFASGVVVLGILEVVAVWWLFWRYKRRKQAQIATLPSFSMEDPNAPSRISIEGELWVAAVSPTQLESAVKGSSQKPLKDRKQKKEVDNKAEVSLLLKYAKLQERNLILSGTDGTTSVLQLEGCNITAVSSSASASRKWAKKYPIKVEHATRTFLGTTVCLLYFKTGWEKEVWCEALRAAARKNYGPDDWYSRLKHEFGEYVVQLKQHYPEVFKSGSGSGKHLKGSAPSTKKSISWKRLLKKKKGEGAKMKAVTVQTEDVRLDESLSASTSYHDFENMKGESDTNQSDTNPEGSTGSKRTFIDAEFGSSDLDSLIPKQIDGGTASLNLMLSRLFFDLYHNANFIEVVQTRIQTLLSRIPTPSYISPITCSGIDIGKCCPFVHALRPLPIMDDVFGIEADLEYKGGAVVILETRLDMRESRVGDQKPEASSAGAATTDIINKSLETVEDDLEVAGDAAADQGSGSSKRKRWSQWKAFLSSVADQVSQVPLTLAMRVVSLKGTLQLRIRASPSDRIWYSFSSMPALELLPEPSVGDHKITTGPLLAYIAERIQILVYETMVYPNAEDIHIPWMVSDAENWVQQNAAPFPQVLPDPKFPEKPKENRFEGEAAGGHVAFDGTAETGAISELEKPLLKQEEAEHYEEAPEATDSAPGSEYQGSDGEPNLRTTTSDEFKRRKGNRREKMLSLGKKFEEKTRLFAEKMRERFEKD